MKEGRALLIDDFRCFNVNVIARNYHDGIWELEHHGPWATLYLDYDFGDLGSYDSERNRQMNGHDVLVWLEEHPQFIPEEITIVSDNPSGVERMKLALAALERKLGRKL